MASRYTVDFVGLDEFRTHDSASNTGPNLAAVWLFAFIRTPAIHRDPEALWAWPLTLAARDAAILADLTVLVLAPAPFAGRGYAVRATYLWERQTRYSGPLPFLSDHNPILRHSLYIRKQTNSCH